MMWKEKGKGALEGRKIMIMHATCSEGWAKETALQIPAQPSLFHCSFFWLLLTDNQPVRALGPMLPVGWGTNSHFKHFILSCSGSQGTYLRAIFMKCLNPQMRMGVVLNPESHPCSPCHGWMHSLQWWRSECIHHMELLLASGGGYLPLPSKFLLASRWHILGCGWEGSQEPDPSSVSSQPPFYFNIHLRLFEWALKKNCLSLSNVILMDTDVFMIIHKISETEFYGHTATLKSPSLSWEIVYVKDDGGNF